MVINPNPFKWFWFGYGLVCKKRNDILTSILDNLEHKYWGLLIATCTMAVSVA
jgi:hypothetical protein